MAEKLENENTLRLANQWLNIDVNSTTRAQINDLINDGNYTKLDELLSNRIVFGTAGLRARMEAGFSRMNDVTVLQASQGLAEYIKSTKGVDQEATIVIGHDHRNNSKRFAELTASAFLIKGFTVYYLEHNCATPMVPFAIDMYRSLGGIMITASHNPKDDNGYKVYWSNGCQIIPPHDHGIQESILQNLEPTLTNMWETEAIMDTDKLINCFDQVNTNYEDHLISTLKPTQLEDFKYVYTPMHGVGLRFAQKIAMAYTKVDNFVVVNEQANPDPEFTTVKFPNPEEKGALDLAIATADKNNVSLIVANDPDADRFTAAFKSNVSKKWKQLSGNEIGILFADYVIQRAIANGEDLSKIYILNSTVSSQMLRSIAAIEGCHFEDTLTGFKWIGNKAIELEGENFSVPFAYEEAIGFMFPTVHDKDGISAMVMFLQLYNNLLLQKLDPQQKLEQLYQKYGYFKQCNGYYITPSPEIMDEIFNKVIRVEQDASNPPYPSNIGIYSVDEWRDLTIGFDSTTPDHKPKLHVDPNSQMVTVKLLTGINGEFIRFTARGSGTEPKLKVYIEAKAETVTRSQELASDVWDTLCREWFKPDKNGLVMKLV